MAGWLDPCFLNGHGGNTDVRGEGITLPRIQLSQEITFDLMLI